MPQPPKAQNGVGEIVAKIMFKHTFSSRFLLCFPSKQGVQNNPACLWLLASYFRAANCRHGEGKRVVAQGGGRRKPRRAGRTKSGFRLPPPPNPVQEKGYPALRDAPDAPHREQGKGKRGRTNSFFPHLSPCSSPAILTTRVPYLSYKPQPRRFARV